MFELFACHARSVGLTEGATPATDSSERKIRDNIFIMALQAAGYLMLTVTIDRCSVAARAAWATLEHALPLLLRDLRRGSAGSSAGSTAAACEMAPIGAPSEKPASPSSTTMVSPAGGIFPAEEVLRRAGEAQQPPALMRALDLSVRHAGARAPALRNVRMSVRHGERVALLGNNGGGKSSLFGALALGLAVPAAGQVHIGGRYAMRSRRDTAMHSLSPTVPLRQGPRQ